MNTKLLVIPINSTQDLQLVASVFQYGEVKCYSVYDAVPFSWHQKLTWRWHPGTITKCISCQDQLNYKYFYYRGIYEKHSKTN